MSAPENTVYQFNFKTPAGDLFNIYASTGPEALELLDFYADSILPKLTGVMGQQHAASAVAPIAAPASQQGPQAPAFVSQQPPAPQGGAQHICGCGIPMILRPAGVSKTTGKPYSGFYTCANGKQGCGQTRNL